MKYKVLISFAGHYDYKGEEIPISAGMNEVIDIPKNKGFEAAGLIEPVKKPARKREAAARPAPTKRSK